MDPHANQPGYYLNYDTGTWMPVQNIVPMSPYPAAPPAADPHANEPGYVFSYDTGTWIPTQNINPQSPYPATPPAGPTAPVYDGGQTGYGVQPADQQRPVHTQPPPVAPPVPSPLSPTTNNSYGNLTSNPNAPANVYQPSHLPTYGVNNPQTYAQQVNAGRTQPQPNQAGLGGGTNTYGRMPPTGADFGSRQYVNPNDQRGGMTMTPQPTYNPAVSIPTGEHPLNPYHGGTAAPPIPSYAVPGGRQLNSGLNPYTLSSGLTAYNPGSAFQRAPAGSGVAYQPANHFPMLQGLQGPQHQGGGFNMQHVMSRFGGY